MILAKRIFLLLITCLFLSSLTKQVFAQLDSIPKANEEAILINSRMLNEQRSIWIRLPNSYFSTNQKFPVIYLLDGEGHFKYVSEMVDYLSSYDRNRIPEMIVVGVVNVDRGRDFTPVFSDLVDGKVDSNNVLTTQGAGNFLNFIQHELVPYIDSNYRTQPYRILSGHSLGGLFAFYTKQTVPDLFKSTILISPAIKGVKDRLLVELPSFFRNNSQLSGKLFVSIGNENTECVDSLTQQLKVWAPSSFNWSFMRYENENHFSVTYKAMFDALKFIYANWFIDFYDATKMSYKDIQLHFDKLSTEFGYLIEPTEDFVNNCGYKQLRIGNMDGAIEIFKENIQNHPNSYNVYDSMGEAYMLSGQTDLAVAYYEKSIAINPNNENGKTMLKKLRHK